MSEAVFLSIPKCAERTGISKDHLYKLCNRRKIEYIKIGKKYLLHYPHLMEYLQAEAEKAVK